MLSSMSGRGRLPAAQKPYTLIPKPPNSGLHDPKDRARRSHVARGHALLPRADTCCALVFQNIDRQIPELNPPYNVSLNKVYLRIIHQLNSSSINFPSKPHFSKRSVESKTFQKKIAIKFPFKHDIFKLIKIGTVSI